MKPKPSYRYSAAVLEVQDGDSIVVSLDFGFGLRQKVPLRFFGLNAREKNDKDPADRARAMAAMKFVEDHLGGKEIITETIKPTEKYGRYLAKVYLADGRCLNDMLIENGLAQPWDGQGEKP